MADFWAGVSKTESCWPWLGAIASTGYGVMTSADNRKVFAHRVSYELHREPIPDGMVIDHLCRVRHCVNPDHLRVVTNAENVLCGVGLTAENARKTHCKRGHALTGANLYIPPKRPSERQCRACRLEHCRKQRASVTCGAPTLAGGKCRHQISRGKRCGNHDRTYAAALLAAARAAEEEGRCA